MLVGEVASIAEIAIMVTNISDVIRQYCSGVWHKDGAGWICFMQSVSWVKVDST
jgi:hypothetical protein